MALTNKVTCPCCNTILVVDRVSGEILETREPITPESTGDRYDDIMKKVKGRTTAAEDKFQRFNAEKKEKMAKLDALFNDRLKEAEEGGPTEKVNPLEQD